MNYNEWLLCVEKTLKKDGRPPLRRLDPEALRDAFDAGESPILFSKRADLPTRHKAQKSVKVSRSWAWLIVPVMLIPLALTVRLGVESKREEEGWKRLIGRRSWPVSLPMKVNDASYVPAEAAEAVAKAKEGIVERLLSPKEGKFLTCDVIAAPYPGGYLIDGSIEAPNQYGTRVVARFQVVAGRLHRVTHYPAPRAAESKRLAEEWSVSVKSLESQPTSTVWRESEGRSMPDFNPKGAAKWPPRRGNLYSEP